MNVFVTTPRSLAGYFFAQSFRISLNRCIRAFSAACILMFAGNAYAVITVGLAIENDMDSNGNITVINGDKVKVAYTVIEDTDKDLKKSDKIQLLRVSDDSIVASVARGKKKSGSISLKIKNSEGEQLYVRYIRKSGTVIATAPDQVTSIPKASLADLTVGLNALITPQDGQVIAFPNSCIRTGSNTPMYDDMNTSTPDGNTYGPGLLSADTTANSLHRFFCPIPLQVPPGANVTITGADFNMFDGAATCRIQGQIRHKVFGTADSGTIVSNVHSGANASDFAYDRVNFPETKSFPTFSLAINPNTIVWVNVILAFNSTGGGQCRYLGTLVNYTVTK